MVQAVAVGQVVIRGAPLSSITDAVAPLPGMKFAPCTSKGILWIAPAMALEGRIFSITGPVVSAMLDDANFVASAWLVTITEIALGDGAVVGAE